MFRSERLCISCLCIVYLLILLDLATGFPETYGNPSADFNTHSIVRPILRHGRTKRDITTTRHWTGLHHTEVAVPVSISGKDYELELRLNEHLVPSGHTLSYQQDGETKVLTLGKEELDICQYSGRVRDKPGSWAAVSTCHGVRGVIYDGQQMRYIEPAADDINGDHFMYSHEQLTKQHRCGHEGRIHSTSYNPQQRGKQLTQKSSRSRISRYKRQLSEDTLVREPNNVNSHTRYVELVLVVDNEEFRASGGDLRRVHHRMKDLANIINSNDPYAPLNIFIALVGVEVWSHHDKIVISEKSDDTLSQFALYRESELLARIPNDNAHLLTRQKFLDDVVGKALMGVMCSKKSSAGIATDHSPVVGLVAMTIAHEMGHNFGMDHDHEECKCPSRKCIMSPVSSMVTPLHWSVCSLRSLSLSFEKGMDYCLRNKPERLLGSSTCGNGFLEEGEQCDCGTAPGEPSPKDSDRGGCQRCCKPDCTLRANATCGHGQCCDLTMCHYKPIATECRSAQQECDLPEFCTGDSQFCPKDLHKMDTTPCGNQQGHCMRGWCGSHARQCRLLWGAAAGADAACYSENARGDQFGNCGIARSGIFKPCAQQDVKCGLLQCRHYNNKLEYGLENAVVGSTFPIYDGKLINPCRTVVTGLGGSGVDPGMVPDGAKCGPDQICLGQKCEPLDRVRAKMVREGIVCPSNCSGHGVCNSNGNCHSNPGFAPPLCELPGAGGSYGSGPATDLSGLKIFMVVVYVIFLGIVPAVVLVLLLFYFFCPSAFSRCRNPSGSYIQKLSQRTNKINGYRSKFTLPNISSFGKWTNKGKNDFKSSNLNVTSKLVVDETPASKNVSTSKTKSVMELNISNVTRPSVNVTKTTVATTQCKRMIDNNKKKNVKEPIRLNRKINKEDIVIIENYTNVAIHITGGNNLNVDVKPKVDISGKKFESPNNIVNTPNINAVNSLQIEVVKKNFEASTGGKKPTSSFLIKSKPNVSSHPNVNFKPSINDKPKLSTKMPSENKFVAETLKTNDASTNNDLVNQRSKLRKVTGRDITK